MSLLAILFGAYVVLGLIAAVVMIVLDHSKKRAGIATLVGDLTGFLPVVFIIFVALWPLCLAVTLLSDDKSPSAKEKTPNQPPDPTAPSGRGSS